MLQIVYVTGVSVAK